MKRGKNVKKKKATKRKAKPASFGSNLMEFTRTISLSIIRPRPQTGLNQFLGFMVIAGIALVGYGLMTMGEEASSLQKAIFN